MKPLTKLEIRQQAETAGMSEIRVMVPALVKQRLQEEAKLEGMCMTDYVLLKLGVLKNPSFKDTDKINTFGVRAKVPKCKRFNEGHHVRLKGGVHTTRSGHTFRHHAKGGEVIYEVRTSMDSIFKPWSGEKQFHSLFYSRYGKHLATYNSGHHIDVSVEFMNDLLGDSTRSKPETELEYHAKAIPPTQVQDQDLGS